jgi:DNA-binding response OmpR family regulator
MKCKQILVVEDDEDIRKQVTQALKFEGYEVLTAPNGKRALELLLQLPAEELPGCMILDLMMPEMDGKTLIETMNENYRERFSEIKILIATAKGSPVNPDLIPGAVERIQKPFDLDELYRVVEEHCGKPDNK